MTSKKCKTHKESKWVRRVLFVRKVAIEGNPWASCYASKQITHSWGPSKRIGESKSRQKR